MISAGIVGRIPPLVVRGRWIVSLAPVDAQKQHPAHHRHKETRGRDLLLHDHRRLGRKAHRQRQRRDRAADAEIERQAHQRGTRSRYRPSGKANRNDGAERDQEELERLKV